MGVKDQKTKPEFDEKTLGKLLEAAHVLQEHSRSLAHRAEEHVEPLAPQQEELLKAPWEESTAETQAAVPDNSATSDFTLTLAHIVETQHQIQTRKLSLEDASALVAKRAARIANASGASVCLLEEDGVRTLAGCGRSALTVGTRVSLPQALSKACLRTGHVVRCSDINQEFLVDADQSRRRGIMALIAVPIFRDGDIAGALEVYFAGPQTIGDQDVHSCQLAAGLITEVLGRDQKQEAPFRAHEDEDPCPACGHNFQPLEQFCGKCGAARPKRLEDQAALTPLETPRSSGHTGTLTLRPEADSGSPGADVQPMIESANPVGLKEEGATEAVNTEVASSSQALAKTGADAWASAADARNFLESVATARNASGLRAFWRAHRGDLSLAGAVVLVAIAIRWGIWSSPVGASSRPLTPGHRRHIDPEAGLSVGDKILISLGLADPPDPPEDKGNPSTQVWVDEKTGLYYCPAGDLYGKTAKGKYETQRDAQLDQYEPADRRACD